MTTNLEKRVAAFHGNVFFREFSFSRNQFRPTPKDELEFADQVVHCGGNFLVYQLKERQPADVGTLDQDSEELWFQKKIVKHASSQIRDTLRYLKEISSIELTNQQGLVVDIVSLEKSKIHKLIIYETPRLDLLPNRLRHRVSKEAGFIHLFASIEYVQICEWLYTPAEISEYLAFREGALSKDSSISEPALLGQFVSENTKEKPSESFSKVLNTFVNDVDEFDIRHIVSIFHARIENDGGHPQNYYKVLSALAELNRSGLRLFVERFSLCALAARNQEDPLGPTLFFTEDCGFIFITPPRQLNRGQRSHLLANATEAAKHHGKVDKQIGVSFAWDVPKRDWGLTSNGTETLHKDGSISRFTSRHWWAPVKPKNPGELAICA